MQNVPIKFRADSAVGKVYGFYVEREGKPYIVDDAGNWVSVERASLRQLCGFDADGNEVYEMDKVVLDYDPKPFELSFTVKAAYYSTNNDDFCITIPFASAHFRKVIN